MSKYQDRLLEFFEEPDNFEAACDVAEQFSTVKIHLLKKCWAEIEEELKHEMSMYAGWKVFSSPDIFERHSKMGVYRGEFCEVINGHANISICIEKLTEGSYYGIWVDIRNRTQKQPQVIEYITKIKNDWRSDGMDTYWPMFKHTEINFSNMKDVRKLHSAGRRELVDTIKTLFMGLFVKVKDDLERIYAPVSL